MSYEAKMINPETGRMFDQLAELIRDAIIVPNTLLPEQYHNLRDGGRSLQELEVMITARENQESEYRKLKREKAERTAQYRKQWEDNPESELTYNVDEGKLYAAQLKFVERAVEAGMMEFDDKF